jgi:TonB-linked SusC/RagA family outer membrane protein
MKKHLLLSLTLLCLLTSNAWAQTRTVSGRVTGPDGAPLPGVTVVEQGTTNGISTTSDGNYSLTVQEGATLVFSFIGFANQEVSIAGRPNTIDIRMATDTRQLSEVVVTALGIQREERSLGYAVQEISGGALDRAREVNVVNSLSGKVAGVQVTGASGNMGGSSRILIRGANSIAGNNQPLFVIDGVPIDNTTYTTTNQARGASGYDYGNMAQDINPDDIESVSVLKGPSAAALYGTRASNGVILITTKSGRGTQGIGVTVNSGVTFDNVFILPKYQNEFGGGLGPFTPYNLPAGQHPDAYFAMDESWGPRLDGRLVRQWYSYYEGDPDFGQATPWVPSPNNIRDFFETGTTFNNNVAVQGGNEKTNFRLSYTNLEQKFVLPNSRLGRNTLAFSGGSNLTDKLSVGVSANYVSSAAKGRPGTGYSGQNVMQQFNQWSQRQMSMDKLREYRGVGGIQRTWNITSASDLTPKYSDNPYWTRYENYQNDSRERVFGNFNVSYAFTDWLKLTGRVMNDSYTDRREERIAVGSQAIPQYMEAVREFRETNSDLILNLNRDFGEAFSLNAFVGGNRMYTRYNLNQGDTQGGLSVPGFYNLRNSNGPVLVTDNTSERAINSVFGSASLGYQDMLYLDMTLRNDWSSTLPRENNSYMYPSATASFVFTELGPLRDLPALDFGKIRVGWAQVGNDTDPYRLLTTYSALQPFGSSPRFTVPNAQNNPDLRPERTTSWEVGADLRFLDNRIRLDVTYYDSYTIDQIFPVDISASSGFRSTIINAGRMENNGVEVILNLSPIRTPDFNWDITFNWARNRNRVVELIEGVNTFLIGTAPFGITVNARAGEPYGTMTGRTFVYDEQGRKVVGANGLYQVTSGVEVLGNVVPDWTGGINNRFSYKGINASFLIDGQRGGNLYSISNMFGKYSGMYEETVAGNIRELGVIADGVKADGSPNDTRVAASSFFQSMYPIAGAHVYDASFIKLREATIGYTFPDRLFGNTPFRGVTISAVGRNLALLLRKIPHVDPEAALSATNIQGIEGAQLPSVRSIGFNVNFRL